MNLTYDSLMLNIFLYPFNKISRSSIEIFCKTFTSCYFKQHTYLTLKILYNALCGLKELNKGNLTSIRSRLLKALTILMVLMVA